jgi:ABC-2 type transport system ATP-binding protein
MIVIDSLSKRYGAREAVRGVSLRVAGGEVAALVGPNGAGKSTILKTVAGTVRPGAGSVRIGGRDIVKEPEAARASLGYVPQRLVIAEHASVEDVCRLVLSLRDLTFGVTQVLEPVGLAGRERSRVGELSGGQKQRLSLALALAGSPRALVLDEPSISLDAEGAEVMGNAIASARQRGAAVLLATHHLHEVAQVADRIVVLQAGRIAAEAASTALRDPRALEAFYHDAIRRSVLHVA